MDTVTQKISRAHLYLFGMSGILTLVIGMCIAVMVPAIRYTPLWEPVVKNIDPSEIHEAMKKNPENFMFIDVRPQEMYTKLHAEDSLNIPIHLFYDKRQEFPTSEKTIVLICSGGRLSGVAYSYLEHYGFRNIVRVEGGVENWQAQGLPVVLGDVLNQG